MSNDLVGGEIQLFNITPIGKLSKTFISGSILDVLDIGWVAVSFTELTILASEDILL